MAKDVNDVPVFLPLSTLNTVTQKADQILVTDMANCFNFHPEFSLSLPSAHNKQSYYYKEEGRRVKAWTATASIQNCYRKTHKLLRIFLTATGVPFDNLPRYTTPYPPSPITLSFAKRLVASSRSLSVNQWPQPR